MKSLKVFIVAAGCAAISSSPLLAQNTASNAAPVAGLAPMPAGTNAVGRNIAQMSPQEREEFMQKRRAEFEKMRSEKMLERAKQMGINTDEFKNLPPQEQQRKLFEKMRQQRSDASTEAMRTEWAKRFGLKPEELKGLPPEQVKAKVKEAVEKKTAELEKKKADGKLTAEETRELTGLQMMKSHGFGPMGPLQTPVPRKTEVPPGPKADAALKTDAPPVPKQ